MLLSFTVSAESTDCQQHKCIAVIDGGSTGSRLHIYSYDVDQSQTAINIKELWSKKVKPGLSTLEPNQAAMNAYFKTLFTGAPKVKIPVYLYATAGMRLLAQPKQQQVYGMVKNWFSTQPQWQLRAAKTITGTEEGLYAWLMINYQLGTLNSDNKPYVGVMDMGGASVQIMLPVENAESLNDSDLVQFNLYGRQRKLFVHSFLGLGQNEVTHQYLNSPSCFANDYELPNGLLANGDAYSCEREVSLLTNGVHRVNQLIQPVIAANPMNQWFVLGGMAELVQSKPLQFESKQFTNEALLEQANTQVCQQAWSGLNAQYNNNEYLYGYCLFPAYYYALIVEGYGIPANQTINYLPSNQAGDWSLGVVLKQGS
ncbi:MAG: multidrug DMT transporter permease [Tatlockia sp.]|nr:multidrug DMT transporter permease [Tatlockia sp.]